MNDILEIKALCSKVCLLLVTAPNDAAFEFNDILYRLCIADFVDQNGEMNNANVKNINSVLFYAKLLPSALSRLNAFNLIINDGGIIKKTFSCDLYYKRCLESENNSVMSLIEQIKHTHEFCKNIKCVEEKYKLLCEKYVEKRIREEFE